MAAAKAIRLAGIVKSYDRHEVLHGVELDVAPGEFVSMLGPSGSGKTTVLKIIAGFEEPDAGSVAIGGREMTGVLPEKRNIGVVFQNYSLFPHLNVAGNIGFPLCMRGVPRADRQARIEAALALVDLAGYATRMPDQLSGGQQQRVAIARAIVFEPDILLMDEPLGALDRRLRSDMQAEIKALHDRLGITIVYVTHDQEEALSMSDRVAVFNAGRIEQIGRPRDVYRAPATLFVAGFLGDSLFLTARIAQGRAHLSGDAGTLDPQAATVAGAARLLWRSDEVEVVPVPDGIVQTGARVVVPADVLSASYAGTSVRLGVRLPTGDTGTVLASERAEIRSGDRVGIALDLGRAAILPDDGAGADEGDRT